MAYRYESSFLSELSNRILSFLSVYAFHSVFIRSVIHLFCSVIHLITERMRHKSIDDILAI